MLAHGPAFSLRAPGFAVFSSRIACSPRSHKDIVARHGFNSLMTTSNEQRRYLHVARRVSGYRVSSAILGAQESQSSACTSSAAPQNQNEIPMSFNLFARHVWNSSTAPLAPARPVY